MIVVVGIAVALLLVRYHTLLVRFPPQQPLKLRGSVIIRSNDVDKRSPISGVIVSAAEGTAVQPTQSTSSGYFELTLGKQVRAGEPLVVHFRHPEYEPFDLNALANDELYVVRMLPIAPPSPTTARLPHVVISDITVRYSVKTTALQNVGSTAKTFRVVNTGNVPCRRQNPCSPDGRWKAAVGSASFNAPAESFFTNARVSCIAGPCPFTRVLTRGLSDSGPTISVSILDWSDTTTFLFEAEVVRSITSEDVRFSYPVIFGQTLHFTVPVSAEGVCIEADVNREQIVFPLGPEPRLSWASCTAVLNPDRTTAYGCELNPGYAFQ